MSTEDRQPTPIIPRETAIHMLQRVQLAASVVVAAAHWAEMPASRRRRGALLDTIDALSDHVGLS